jgi:hypothetical protein
MLRKCKYIVIVSILATNLVSLVSADDQAKNIEEYVKSISVEKFNPYFCLPTESIADAVTNYSLDYRFDQYRKLRRDRQSIATEELYNILIPSLGTWLSNNPVDALLTDAIAALPVGLFIGSLFVKDSDTIRSLRTAAIFTIPLPYITTVAIPWKAAVEYNERLWRMLRLSDQQ